MKKLLILFSTLLVAFMGVWVFQSKTPINRPEEVAEEAENLAWWNNSSEVPKVDAKWILDPEIPENYVPVPGKTEVYMVVNDEGKITEYRQRTKQDDGSWLWKTINPDIPDGYVAVEGLKNVYKVKNSDGTYSYYKYVRNDDDTFAFVPVDENGKVIENNAPKGSEIPNNYKHITGNVYAVYNENGVIIGYKERKIDKNGDYYWVDCEKPKVTTNNSNSGYTVPKTSTNTNSYTNKAPNSNNGNSYTPNNTPTVTNSQKVEHKSDGSYTETETLTTNEEKGGYIITYKTVIVRKYNSSGVLISTKKDGPTEISRVKTNNSSASDKSKIASTLSAELARVSVGLNYNKSLANEVLATINAERVAVGVPSLSLSSTSDAYKLSAIRAANMATENHTDYDSLLYGTLQEMCSKFGVKSTAPSEIVWKTSAGKSAEAIAARLQLLGNKALQSSSYSSIGISIVSKGGYYYINTVLL